jgi:uncharacterized protein with HEPN domain
MHRDKMILLDIYQAIELIFKYTDGVSYDDLENNQEKQDAILRRITIIGEATKRLSWEFREKHQQIPWKKIAGMRDVITHNYDEVEIQEIWTVIKVNLPELFNYIKPLVTTEQIN